MSYITAASSLGQSPFLMTSLHKCHNSHTSSSFQQYGANTTSYLDTYGSNIQTNYSGK